MNWRFCIPIIIGIIFVVLCTTGYYYAIFAVLLLANFLNLIWGEFSTKEIKAELYRFYISSTGHIIKRFSAIILIGISIWVFYFVASHLQLSIKSVVLFGITYGVLVGCFHVTLAHDLLHSSKKFDKFLSSVLLLLANIPHLAVDHVFGHHRNIGLKNDSSTAKLNQNFYHYFISVSKSRLYEVYCNQFSLPSYAKNKIKTTGIYLLFIQILIWIILLLLFPNAKLLFLFFLVQGFTAYLLYELINYIQHYGLTRKTIDCPIEQHLAWNCYFKYTNYFLYLLPLHSLHHLPKSEKKKAMHQLKAGPKMPYLYFVMVFLALIPPLWFRKINPLVLQIDQNDSNEIH